jgi:hypothetical protein
MTEYPVSYVFDATTLAISKTLHINGYITDINLVIPNYTNTINTSVSIQRANGYEIWNSGAKSQNATYEVPTPMTDADKVDIPVDYDYLMVVTLAGVAGGTANKTVKVTLFVMDV